MAAGTQVGLRQDVLGQEVWKSSCFTHIFFPQGIHKHRFVSSLLTGLCTDFPNPARAGILLHMFHSTF